MDSKRIDCVTLLIAIDSLESGLENTRELLAEHERSLGRTTTKNKRTAERYEEEILQMEGAIELLKTSR